MLFIVFEGIDGGGKTTVSTQVVKGLRARGVPVEYVRDGSNTDSPLANRMREFGKGDRNMAMTPEAELFFHVARDVQIASELIRPALDIGTLVVADRYLYTHQVLGHYGRELDCDYVQQIVTAAADGLWPDLVYLMDVDPYIARARRRVSKLLKKGRRGDDDGGVGASRIGLRGGVGLQHHLRAGYLEMAYDDRRRWVVIGNSDPTDPDSAIYAMVTRITDQITEKWQEQMSASHHVLGAITAIRRASSSPAAIAMPTDVPVSGLRAFNDARLAFYETLRQRARREVAVAAYFLSRMEDRQAWKLRNAWAHLVPGIVAFGLRGLDDEQAWQLRDRLRERSLYHVVRSLSGPQVDRRRAFAMRQQYVDKVPGAVLASMVGDDSPEAWALRDSLAEQVDSLLDGHLDRILPSLVGIASERAWQIREHCLASQAHTLTPDPLVISRLVKSLRGLSDTRSWELRNRYIELTPAEVLSSLAGLDDERSWDMREQYAEQAPRLVLATFHGSTDERAWQLRFRFAERLKEVFDSMDGMDQDEAWELRLRYLDNWASTVVKSLGRLGLTERGRQLVMDALARHQENISLLKHVARLAYLEDLARAGAGERSAL